MQAKHPGRLSTRAGQDPGRQSLIQTETQAGRAPGRPGQAPGSPSLRQAKPQACQAQQAKLF